MDHATLDPPPPMQNGSGGSAAGARPHTNGLPAHSSSSASSASSSSSAPASSHQSRLRLPTVTEALPFSPFSSIVPFNPDMMHPPLALSTPPATMFDHAAAVKTTRRELDRLTAGATSAEQASKRCRATLGDIKKLLIADNLTDYKFKSANRVRLGSDAHQPPKQPVLSSFAKMVYDGVKEPHPSRTPPAEPGANLREELVSNAHVPLHQHQQSRPSSVVRPSPQQKAKVIQRPQRPGSAQEPVSLPTAKLVPRPRQSAAEQQSRTTPPQQQHQPPKGTPVPLVPLIPRPRQLPAEKQPRITPPQQLSAEKQSRSPPPQQQQQSKGTPLPLVPLIPRPPHHVQAQFTHHQYQQHTQQNLHLPVSKPVSSHDLPATPSDSPKSKLYVQPLALTPSQRAAFQKVHDAQPDPPSGTLVRNQSAYLTNHAIALGSDQRRKADQAVETLHSQLEAIFEAEDHMQPDTSEAAPVRENQYFSAHDTDEGSALVLQTDAQMLLNTAFRNVVACNRLDSIELDHLTRIQRVCERTVSTLASGSLAMGDDWSADDVFDWVARLQSAGNGIVAARTLLHIMTGGSHRKELQSEDCLRLVLDALRTALDTCIVPIVELRSYLGEKSKDAPSNPKFAVAVENRGALNDLVLATSKTLILLGDLFAKTDVDETGVSSLVYTCKMLIFAENAIHDRDSTLGIPTFENMRKIAMNVMAKVFTKYSDQRKFIIDEILLSLERLPANKQSARQYRLPDAKPIQLVSALLMRLVQSSAAISEKPARQADESDDDESDESSEVQDPEYCDDSVIAVASTTKTASRKSVTTNCGTSLAAIYQPLQQECSSTARHIAGMLLQRAVGKSKSNADDPFRRLLDVFTDDFINVLGSTDWPAAELLLRHLIGRLIPMADDSKQPAPARTLALELLGTVGSGILDTLKATTDSARTTESHDPVSQGLAAIGQQAESGDIDLRVVTSFVGPFRVLLEYLHARGVEKDLQLLSARGYHLVQWAEMVLNLNKGPGSDDEPPPSTAALQNKIRAMMVDVHWLEDNSRFAQPTTCQGKLAAKIVTSSSSLCRAFPKILHTIMQSMTSPQPTVRSRALKSVTDLLEKDPGILDRTKSVLQQIVRALADPSSLVRESALTLIQKCVALRPSLELKIYEKIVERTTDANANVRKRSMAFLKQVYMNSHDNTIRAKISNSMISRIHDVDEGVAETARNTTEDIWFSAFRHLRGEADRSVDTKLELAGQVALIVQTVDLGDEVAAVLEALLRTLMTTSKQAGDNNRVCKSFVGILFEGIINPSEIPGAPSQAAILRTLTVFAKTAPGLITASQVELLGPYTRNLNNTDDLEIFHFVVTILRYTMPGLTGLKAEFLQQMQSDLLQAVPRLPKSDLAAAAPCLWTIDTLLGNRVRLVKFIISVLAGLLDPSIDSNKPKAAKLLRILGQFGKACQFDENLETITSVPPLKWYRGDSVAGLMVEVCCKFTRPKQPMHVREAAVEAVCAISYAYPKNYLRSDVVSAIEIILEGREAVLEEALLFSLETFFASGEKLEADPTAPQLGAGIESGTERLANTYQAVGADVALNSLCQRFLSQFLRIALSSLDGVALCAARLVACINRQGLMVPTESAPGLVALQTCSVPAIAKTAFLSYKQQFIRYPGTLDKTLLKSVQLSYEYQRNVIHDASGCSGHPPTAKLHYFWEVLRKDALPKTRPKFFDQTCASLTFDPTAMTDVEQLRQHLLYVRYCVENMAFLDHDKITDPLHLVSCLEKAYAGAGLAVAQAIECDVFKLQLPVPTHPPPVASETRPDGSPDAAIAVGPPAPVSDASVDSARMRQLATSAQILSLVVETRNFLRNLWLLTKYGDTSATKAKLKASKDADKHATRATNAPALADAYQTRIADIMAAAADEPAQRHICSAFVELMTIDHDAHLASGDDDDADDDDDGDDDILMDDDDDDAAGREARRSKSPAPRGKKRKPTTDAPAAPHRKKARPKKTRLPKHDDDFEAGWD